MGKRGMGKGKGRKEIRDAGWFWVSVWEACGTNPHVMDREVGRWRRIAK